MIAFARAASAAVCGLTGWTGAHVDRNVDGMATTLRGVSMIDPCTKVTPDFQRGWDAALLAARNWHDSQAKKTLIQARRDRFPKNLERVAAVHQRSAEMIANLSPDDV